MVVFFDLSFKDSLKVESMQSFNIAVGSLIQNQKQAGFLANHVIQRCKNILQIYMKMVLKKANILQHIG